MSSKLLGYNSVNGGFDYLTCDATGKLKVSIDASTIEINDVDVLAQLVASNVVLEATRGFAASQVTSSASTNTKLDGINSQMVASNVVLEATRAVSQLTFVEAGLTNLALADVRDGITVGNTKLTSIDSELDTIRLQATASNVVLSSIDTRLSAPVSVYRGQLGGFGNVMSNGTLAPLASTNSFNISQYGWFNGYYQDSTISCYDSVKVLLSFDGAVWIDAQNSIMPTVSGDFRVGFIYKTDTPAIQYVKFKNTSSTTTLTGVNISLTGGSF